MGFQPMRGGEAPALRLPIFTMRASFETASALASISTVLEMTNVGGGAVN
jgi:hypothetical protein